MRSISQDIFAVVQREHFQAKQAPTRLFRIPTMSSAFILDERRDGPNWKFYLIGCRKDCCMT